MGSLLLLAWVAFLLPAAPSFADSRTVEGTVTRVVDGDTLTLVTDEGTKHKVRLFGIDAPEVRHEEMPGQPFGNEARHVLEALVRGRRVTVEIVDIDTHKRLVGIVTSQGKDVNLAMIRQGYAWAYRRFLSAPYASGYIAAERIARERRLGLWKQANPVPPWEFKRGNRGSLAPPPQLWIIAGFLRPTIDRSSGFGSGILGYPY